MTVGSGAYMCASSCLVSRVLPSAREVVLGRALARRWQSRWNHFGGWVTNLYQFDELNGEGDDTVPAQGCIALPLDAIHVYRERGTAPSHTGFINNIIS